MSDVTKAVILAAGRGTRMGELTKDIPKPMLPVGPKPLLEHLLDTLRAVGIQQAGIVIGYRGELIEQHFARYPMPISWFRQSELNGTAPAVALARDFIGSDPFLLVFGDIWCEANDYRGLINVLNEAPDIEAVLGVRWVDDPWRGAAVYVDDDECVTQILEKPPKGTSGTHWNSAGMYVFRPSIMQEIDRVPLSPRGEYEIASAIEQLIQRPCAVRYYAISGRWLDVGRPEDLNALSKALGYAPEHK